MTANQSIIEQLTVMENACAEMRKTLGLAEITVKSKKSKSKSKSSGSGDESEPKEKKAPSAYIVFSSKMVGPTVRKAIEGTERKISVGTVTQFAGHLWGQKKEWTEEEILSAWETFTPPEVSKQALAGKNKTGSTGSGEKAAPVADDAEVAEGKVKKPQSEETKAKAKAKREANKAKKAAEAKETAADDEEEEETAADDEETPADEEEEEAPEPVVVAKPAAKPAAKTVAKPVAKAEPAKPAAKPEPVKKGVKVVPKKPVDLLLDEWTHDGTTYYKNERGDVISMENEWVGHWNGKEIEEADEPADRESLTTRD
jgi:cobalamin biosynthesis protein CobT